MPSSEERRLPRKCSCPNRRWLVFWQVKEKLHFTIVRSVVTLIHHDFDQPPATSSLVLIPSYLLSSSYNSYLLSSGCWFSSSSVFYLSSLYPWTENIPSQNIFIHLTAAGSARYFCTSLSFGDRIHTRAGLSSKGTPQLYSSCKLNDLFNHSHESPTIYPRSFDLPELPESSSVLTKLAFVLLIKRPNNPSWVIIIILRCRISWHISGMAYVRVFRKCHSLRLMMLTVNPCSSWCHVAQHGRYGLPVRMGWP